MIRFCLILFLTLSGSVFSKADTTVLVDTSRLRISLLTCGAGLQPWETFGHTAIRITDSAKGTDNVYNYGTFDGYDEDFLMKFSRGKLLYYLSFYPYRQFVLEYADAGRSVEEQELILPGQAKQTLYEYLDWNAREENRYYKYDFFFDNCATRIRDVFHRAWGKHFQLGSALDSNEKITFRQIINEYFYRVHWQRFGVNLLLGSRIDSVMTSRDIMFLPDYLQKGISASTYKGALFAADPDMVVPGPEKTGAGLNGPFILMLSVLLLTIAGLFIRRWKKLGNIMTSTVLFISGFVGCFILVMWFGTDHQTCQNNFNLLWALPTNLVIAFAPSKRRRKYIIVAVILLLLSLLLHIIGVQQMPLKELSPFLLSLLIIYGMIYKPSYFKLS